MTRSEQEQWVRIFDVPETKFHHDGYTVYKIVSTLLHRSFPEASTSLEVWRRYSAILRLHKEIIKLYNHSQLPVCPPAYSKPSIINRYDDEVIESRRKCTLLLLKYCAKYSSLYTSEQFTNFFKEDGGTKKKRLSFSRLKEKKSNSSLASSLGVSEGGLSLYAQLNENTSSNEDLTGGLAEKEYVEDPDIRSPEGVPLRVSDQFGEETSSSICHNSVCYYSSPQETRSSDILFPSAAQLGVASNNFNNAGLRNAQDTISPRNSSSNSKTYHKNPPSEDLSSLQRLRDGSSSDLKPQSFRHFPEEPYNRKKAVKTRTAEYLQKAEQLIAKFSLRDTKFGQSSVKSCRGALKEKSLKFSGSYLKNYRVVGTCGKIIIAIDVATQETVAIKVIEKNSEEKSRKLILPLSVPFMVPIVRYHETDFAFYLTLKYVSGGKLWNHLKKFIKQPSSLPITSSSLPSSFTTYEGQRLIFESHDSSVKDVAENVLAIQELDVSEMDQKSFSFSSDLAVAECKSSIENYSHACPLDRAHYQSSLSNIIDYPHDQNTPFLRKDYLCVSPYLHNEHSTSQTKSRSLDDINSSKAESYQQKSLSVEANDVWTGINYENLNNPNENGSIGNDTLSGMSDDFSCSSLNPAPEVENSDHCSNNTASNKSFSSFPWSKKETSENVTFDVNNLIKNSRKLIEDVNKTLERSKQQIIRTFSSSKRRGAQSAEVLPLTTDTESNSRVCKSKGFSKRNMEHTANDISAQSNDTLGARALLDTNAPQTTYELKHCYRETSTPKKSLNTSATLSFLSKDSSVNETYSKDLIPLPDESSNVFMTETDVKDLRCPSPSLTPFNNMSVSSLLENYSSNLTEGNQQIPEGLVRVWVSQVISAMDHLHTQNIIWGDFNPSNLLLDEGGSILVTYKCFYGNPKHLPGYGFRAKENAGDDWLSSMGYLSPELFNPVSTATRASDWWSVGALLFHLLTGKDVASCHPSGITSHTQINFVSPVSEEAASLIINLLCAHPIERLGSSSTGVQEIKDHPFFFGIEWPE